MKNRQPGEKSGTGFSSRTRFIVLGIVVIVVVWQLLSSTLSDIIIASPSDTFITLGKMLKTTGMWQHLGVTLLRIILGIISGSVIGGLLGVLAGSKQRWQAFLEPLRWVVMTVPSVVILVILLLLFGLGSVQVIVMTGIITLPFTYVSTVEGMQAIDSRLIEMAQVYRIPRRLRLSGIYLPGIGAAVMAGLTLSAGIGVRAAILAEFLGAQDGVGHSLFLSWTHINTPELFSWILLTFVLLGIIELGFLRPLRNVLLRWRKAV